MRAAILVTHLMGSGHLVRALAVAEALEARGVATTLISGGRVLGHIDSGAITVEQLPPVMSDGLNYRVLLEERGAQATDVLMQERRERIGRVLGEISPQILITEQFPFGRRILAGEFLHAVTTAAANTPRPVIAASIRDILEPPSKPARIVEAAARIARYYDVALVHGDPALIRLEDSWPPPASIRPRIRYTGYVARKTAPVGRAECGGEVVVSVGGGVLGRALLDCAAAAAGLGGRRWRLLIGGRDAEQAAARLMSITGPMVIAEPARPDYRDLLSSAACSVSLTGYNTVLEVLAARIPAVFVPMLEAGEQEQRLRGRALARRTHAPVLDARAMSPKGLAAAVERAIAAGPARLSLATNGAGRTAEILVGMARRRGF